MGSRKSMKVRLKNIDTNADNSQLFYRTRMLDVYPTSKSIETPSRILNNADLIAKSKTPSPISLNSPFAGIHLEINTEETGKLFTSNEYPASLISKIESLKQQMQHSNLIFPFIQPSQNAIKTQLVTGEQKLSALRRIIGIQNQAKLQILGIPWLNYSPLMFRTIVTDLLENSEQEYIFYIKADEDPRIIWEISDVILDHIETERLHFIGIIHAKIRNAMTSYDILWEKFRDVNAAIVVANIERMDIDNHNLSSSHLNQCILGDLFLPKVRRGGAGEKKSIDVINRLRIFNHNNLSVTPICNFEENAWIDIIREELPDSRVQFKLSHYREAESSISKYNTLNYISRIHEHLSSTKEFSNTRSFLKQSDIKSYISSKNPLFSVLRQLAYFE